jgi:hypothetical protein
MQNDDELDISMSDPNRFESAKAKRKALEQKLKKEGLQLAAKGPAMADASRLKLSVLRNQFEGQKDDQQKRDQKQKEKAALKSFGTKTREQELKAGQLTADTNPNADQLVQQGNRDDAVQDEQKGTEIQGEGEA